MQYKATIDTGRLGEQTFEAANLDEALLKALEWARNRGWPNLEVDSYLDVHVEGPDGASGARISVGGPAPPPCRPGSCGRSRTVAVENRDAAEHALPAEEPLAWVREVEAQKRLRFAPAFFVVVGAKVTLASEEAVQVAVQAAMDDPRFKMGEADLARAQEILADSYRWGILGGNHAQLGPRMGRWEPAQLDSRQARIP